MAERTEYTTAVIAFDNALTAALEAHDALRAAFAACGGVEGSPNAVPDLTFKPLVTGMVAQWRQRVADAQGWLNG